MSRTPAPLRRSSRPTSSSLICRAAVRGLSLSIALLAAALAPAAADAATMQWNVSGVVDGDPQAPFPVPPDMVPLPFRPGSPVNFTVIVNDGAPDLCGGQSPGAALYYPVRGGGAASIGGVGYSRAAGSGTAVENGALDGNCEFAAPGFVRVRTFETYLADPLADLPPGYDDIGFILSWMGQASPAFPLTLPEQLQALIVVEGGGAPGDILLSYALAVTAVSSVPVPEPAAFSLLAAAAMFGYRHRASRRAREAGA